MTIAARAVWKDQPPAGTFLFLSLIGDLAVSLNLSTNTVAWASVNDRAVL